MTRPLLMQSLPNTGSTWFAALLAKHIPDCRYFDKEFFNPVCNLAHELTLREQFGCELLCCYTNIASPGRDGIDDDIINTWGSESYTFTKECNSAFKLPVFVRHFDCFVFLRKAENIFPPQRVRAWSFYEHAWWALLAAQHDVGEVGLAARAQEAHAILERAVLEDAAALGVPVIWWEDLFTDPHGVVQALSAVTEVDDGLAEAIAVEADRRGRLLVAGRFGA